MSKIRGLNWRGRFVLVVALLLVNFGALPLAEETEMCADCDWILLTVDGVEYAWTLCVPSSSGVLLDNCWAEGGINNSSCFEFGPSCSL